MWRLVPVVMSACLCIATAAEAAHVEVRGEWFYVDGEPFLVKGVGYSPARPGRVPWGDPVSREMMAHDFAKIREAGFNAIRTWAPLTPEQLALAKEHQLMVLQGIWVDPKSDYLSDAFQANMLDTIRQELERSNAADNILLVLVGNELLPERAFAAGLEQTNALLLSAYETVKRVTPLRLVSYANWPQLAALQMDFWDAIAFNLYPYEPRSVAQVFGFRGYIEYLKRTVARNKPLVITELGLSVSPVAGARPGYGGLSLDQQAREVVTLWDTVFQAGAQGACVFEWNDEWWKQNTYRGDEQTHDPSDPEEWFGLTEFASADQTEPTPRPVYGALATYNQAIVVQPVSDESYGERIPVTVYTTERVGRVRVRFEAGKWLPAAQVSPHWWKASLPIPKRRAGRQARVTIQAHDQRGRMLIQHERMIWVQRPLPAVRLTIATDRDRYEGGRGLEPMRYRISAQDEQGRPLGDQTVAFAITEPRMQFDAGAEVVESRRTGPDGTIEGTYLLSEPGLVMLAAGVAPDRKRPDRRIGTERSVVVEPRKVVAAAPAPHQPSVWEQRMPEAMRTALHHPTPAFSLADPGRAFPVDYARYGVFHDVGTARYRYEITDLDALARAVGEGIYPNDMGLVNDPAYRKALREGRLEGNVWDFTFHEDAQLAFFRWAGSDEESPGVKQLFTAMQLERAGLLQAAVKAYEAILVHFPDAVGWTEFNTPWFVGPVARDKIHALIRLHPELGVRLEDAAVVIEGGFDNDGTNDVVRPTPGRLVAVPPEAVNPPTQTLSQRAVARERGKGRVRLRRYDNGHWQLLVDGRPWIIRGISYSVAAVGESHDEETYKDWMTADRNQNQTLDVLETFVDANRNNRHDAEETMVGDFQLFRDMGVNTLRLYHHASNKAVLRQLYDQYGIMVLMGDLVGMYTVGSGAQWEAGTDYLDPVQRKRMTDSVKQMVREFKQEPYVLMWVLGNENNYGGVHGIVGGRGNAAQHPKEFYQFLNELAEWIHREDPQHPVAIANGEWLFLDTIARFMPALDVFGANVYRGSHGFGRSFFEAIRTHLDTPVFISEFGCPAYQAGTSLEEGELGQALYHFGNWVDVEDNMAGRGAGNALGGVVFEWVDEWWKAGQPPRFSAGRQDTIPNWSGPFPGGKMYEEWLGIMSMGDGTASPFLRQPRAAYRLYQALWNDHRRD